MKKFGLLLILALVLGFTMPAVGADFSIHGDLNNRFQIYTQQNSFFVAEQQGVLREQKVEDNFGEAKYRLWTTLKVPQGFDLAKHCELLKGIIEAEDFIPLPAKKLFSLGVGHVSIESGCGNHGQSGIERNQELGRE